MTSEIVPMLYAIATIDNPKAIAIPNVPIPSIPPPMTATPVPNNTSTNVPINSAIAFLT